MSKLTEQRQAFLRAFFPDNSIKYEEKEVNGFMLVKHTVNGNPDKFEINIYPKLHFMKTLGHRGKRSATQVPHDLLSP